MACPERNPRPRLAPYAPLRDGAEMLGLGISVPGQIVTNAEIAERLGTDGDWITSRTGISTRYQCAPGESVADMAAAAARDALASTGVDSGRVDLVVLASCSNSDPLAGTAAAVAREIGADGAGAFELNAACAGFCYALSTVADLLRAGSAQTALVIGAETMTAWIDPADASTAILFGDGAGAAVVTAADMASIGPVTSGSDGSAQELIAIDPASRALHMDGPAVFRWATATLLPTVRQACSEAGVAVGDLDAVVPHQANARIIDVLDRQLGASDLVISRDVTHRGNTSAASIPLALHQMLTERPALSGGLALLVGFGAGLCWAAQVTRLP